MLSFLPAKAVDWLGYRLLWVEVVVGLGVRKDEYGALQLFQLRLVLQPTSPDELKSRYPGSTVYICGDYRLVVAKTWLI